MDEIEEGLISSDEEETLDILLHGGLESGDDEDDELYNPSDVLHSSQDSSQDSSLADDNMAKKTYWKDDSEKDEGSPDPRTTPFRPQNPPGFQFAKFNRREQQQLKSPIDFFKLFLTMELVHQICIATNSQARALISSGKCTSYATDGTWEPVTVDELYGEWIKMRKATMDDYDAVMSIRDSKSVYGGYDNLPDRYKLFLACPTNTGYIAMHDDKVIGFMLSILVNCNKTTCIYGARISRNYSGMSLAMAMLNHIAESEICGKRPSRWAFCLDTKMTFAQFIKTYTLKSDLYIPMAIHPYMSRGRIITKSLQSSKYRIQNSKHLDREDIAFVFRSNNLCRSLFPDGRIINLWNPYKPMVENIPLLMDSRTFIIGSNLDKNDLALLSIGTFSYTHRGVLYNLNIFGNFNKCLDEHLFLHVKALDVKEDSRITMEITVRNNVGDIFTDGIMQTLGFDRPVEYGNYQMFCYEGDFNDIDYRQY